MPSVNWDPSIGIKFFLLGLEQKHILIVTCIVCEVNSQCGTVSGVEGWGEIERR